MFLVRIPYMKIKNEIREENEVMENEPAEIIAKELEENMVFDGGSE